MSFMATVLSLHPRYVIFSKDGVVATMTKKSDGSMWSAQRSYLSTQDIINIQKIYTKK